MAGIGSHTAPNQEARIRLRDSGIKGALVEMWRDSLTAPEEETDGS
jgi:hypothetical protein